MTDTWTLRLVLSRPAAAGPTDPNAPRRITLSGTITAAGGIDLFQVAAGGTVLPDADGAAIDASRLVAAPGGWAFGPVAIRVPGLTTQLSVRIGVDLDASGSLGPGEAITLAVALAPGALSAAFAADLTAPGVWPTLLATSAGQILTLTGALAGQGLEITEG